MKKKLAPGFLREYNSRQTPKEFKTAKYFVLDLGTEFRRDLDGDKLFVNSQTTNLYLQFE